MFAGLYYVDSAYEQLARIDLPDGGNPTILMNNTEALNQLKIFSKRPGELRTFICFVIQRFPNSARCNCHDWKISYCMEMMYSKGIYFLHPSVDFPWGAYGAINYVIMQTVKYFFLEIVHALFNSKPAFAPFSICSRSALSLQLPLLPVTSNYLRPLCSSSK